MAVFLFDRVCLCNRRQVALKQSVVTFCLCFPFRWLVGATGLPHHVSCVLLTGCYFASYMYVHMCGMA